jgi:hypothetical protein
MDVKLNARFLIGFGGNGMDAREWLAANWSNIVTGLITIMIIVTFCFMVATERVIPEIFGLVVTNVIGFFIGAQVPRPAAAKRAEIAANAAAAVAAVRESEPR